LISWRDLKWIFDGYVLSQEGLSDTRKADKESMIHFLDSLMAESCFTNHLTITLELVPLYVSSFPNDCIKSVRK